jgi:hypothetical protein
VPPQPIDNRRLALALARHRVWKAEVEGVPPDDIEVEVRYPHIFAYNPKRERLGDREAVERKLYNEGVTYPPFSWWHQIVQLGRWWRGR